MGLGYTMFTEHPAIRGVRRKLKASPDWGNDGFDITNLFGTDFRDVGKY
jgi:hypothetical protein